MEKRNHFFAPGMKASFQKLGNIKKLFFYHKLTYLDVCKLAKEDGFEISEDDISKAICGRRKLSVEAEKFFIKLFKLQSIKELYE